MCCRTRRASFTFIEEILGVIVVVAVLAPVVAPSALLYAGEAKNATARSQIEMLGAALDAAAGPQALTTSQHPREEGIGITAAARPALPAGTTRAETLT